MDITRRTLFEAGAAAGAGLLLAPVTASAAPAVVPLGLTPFIEQLPTLSELGVIDATSGGRATIEMVNATHKFHSALAATPTYAYRSADIAAAQNYLGPVVVAKQGTSFDLKIVNSLGAHPLASAMDPTVPGTVGADATAPRASTHLHGGNTSPGNDGDPTDTFVPSESKTYHYENSQEAAGLWYHDHALGITRLNVFAGLAGGYLVRNTDDPGDGTTGLPPDTFEVPLVIQDRMFNTNGTFLYPANVNPGTAGRPWAPEFFGDVATVNGKAWPNLNVNRGKYRFRVYNGSNARFYNLSLKSSGSAPTFFQIGSDGGLLNAPVPLTTLLLGPGERADLVIDFAALSAGTKVLLANNARAPFPAGPRSVRRGGTPLPQIMQFTVMTATGWITPLPAALRATPITPLATAARPVAAVRSMTLVENLNSLGSPLMVLLNNRNFEATGATTTVGTNTLEQWELINTTIDAHPIHLHYTQFQVLNRQKFDSAGYMAANYGPQPLAANTGPFPPLPVAAFLKGGPQAPPANERGWKDTVVAMPGEVTRIVVPFGANAAGSLTAFQSSFTGPYAWHCHILEHEDNDMMQRYEII
ncbi:spore coat protein A [Arthrobacter ulcerisalmonis]|nr:multicopper oxidase domain-containing protein [Arthrobacter ulcerisalmonis]MDQ0664541.1 spore coat protein A [Arthrobacter ulcerisalmonis]